jgi:hypothetical protein
VIDKVKTGNDDGQGRDRFGFDKTQVLRAESQTERSYEDKKITRVMHSSYCPFTSDIYILSRFVILSFTVAAEFCGFRLEKPTMVWMQYFGVMSAAPDETM